MFQLSEYDAAGNMTDPAPRHKNPVDQMMSSMWWETPK
jgi:hypothetical protein